MMTQRIIFQLAGAAIGLLVAFGLGLAFNTGSKAVMFEEMAIYCGVGLVAGFFAGRLTHMVVK